MTAAPLMAIVVFPGVQILDVTGPLEVFSTSTRLLSQATYRTTLVSSHGGDVAASCDMRFSTTPIAEVADGDVDTLVVAGGIDMDEPAHDPTLVRALELGTGETACPAGEPAPTDAARVARFEANAAIALRFSPDGARIATAGFDGTVGIWDARTGERILRIAHVGVVGGAAFSPAGRHLLVTHSDEQSDLHSVRVYTLDLDELVAIARGRVTRGLTDDECRVHLGRAGCPDATAG